MAILKYILKVKLPLCVWALRLRAHDVPEPDPGPDPPGGAEAQHHRDQGQRGEGNSRLGRQLPLQPPPLQPLSRQEAKYFGRIRRPSWPSAAP